MTDEIYDYRQLMQEQALAKHRTPVSPPRQQTEKELHEKDGPVQTIVLPNLPSVAGRVKYAIGSMSVSSFSQRCGISASYLAQLCSGKAKTLSAYNGNRIAGASSTGVTVSWLLGLSKSQENPQPTPQPEPELPDIPDFLARLEWAIKRSRMADYDIGPACGHSRAYISNLKRRKGVPKDEARSALAKVLGVPESWLFSGCPTDAERFKQQIETLKRCKKEKQENLSHEQPPQKPLQEKCSSNPLKTHLRFEGVYSGDTLAALVSVLKGTYQVSLSLDEVEDNP